MGYEGHEGHSVCSSRSDKQTECQGNDVDWNGSSNMLVAEMRFEFIKP